MTNTKFKYEPKCVDKIVPREFNFDFPDDLNPLWIPGNRVRSHLFNGLSIPMPYLEPFLMRSVIASKAAVSDPELLEDIKGFVAQEGHHYKCHRRMNELLKSNGYPEFEKIENELEKYYKKLSKKSLAKRLAYCAGFESMTNGITTWLIKNRWKLFKDASPEITSFWLMHMIEETEHKTVAHDVFMVNSGNYFMRFIGVFHGSLHVVGTGFKGMLQSLKKDKELYKFRTVIDIFRELSSFVYNVGPFMFRATLPGYDPRNEIDQSWMMEWVDAYNNHPAKEPLPLVDTHDPKMPIPFLA